MIIGEAQELKGEARALLKGRLEHDFMQEQIVLGISVKDEGDYGLAVRIQSPKRNRALEARIRLLASKLVPPEDLDLAWTGPVVLIPPAKLKKKTDVLRIGSSIAHANTPLGGGTLGFFAKCRLTGDEGFVSNNHVIGLLNKAVVDSDVIRPDGEVVGDFVRSVELKHGGIENRVDASFARLLTANVDRSSLPGGVTLRPDVAAPGESIKVKKFGAKTHASSGEVTSFAYDPFKIIGFAAHLPVVEFDDQIEIKSSNFLGFPFAQPGDSGSLLYNENDRAVGLLFAISGSRTYANPIEFVLRELEVDLST